MIESEPSSTSTPPSTANLEIEVVSYGPRSELELEVAPGRTASFQEQRRPAATTPTTLLSERNETLQSPLSRPVAPAPVQLSPRYEDRGFLGRGGAGEVLRVRDRELFRTVALKVLRRGLTGDAAAASRFVDEAQITAQLEHPAIVPVHDIGRLPDGRVFFTMKEVRGRTLQEVIREVHDGAAHRAHAHEASGASRGPWTFRRLVDVFLRVCEAVAYAHARGVIHRDLKPQNVMVGEYGEVLVLDWGLARVTSPDDFDGGGRVSSPVTISSSDTISPAIPGHIAGTLAYMPLEQALGEDDLIGPASDVYSLGALLYEILCGEPPFSVTSVRQLIDALVDHGALPPSVVLRSRARDRERDQVVAVPEELEAICWKAMAQRPQDRYPHAGALAQAVEAWLEGARSRERALALVAEADAMRPAIQALREDAARLRREAGALLAAIAPHAPVAAKEPAWALEDEAERRERSAETQHVVYLQALRGALTHVADLPEALARISDHYREEHARAEGRGDTLAAARYEALLRAHDKGAHAAYLKGEAALTLITDPPGAIVTVHRYVERGRRLVPELVGSLGRTPIRAVVLPKGSYLLEIKAEGRAPVRYPVVLDRQELWNGVRPGERAPRPVYLPREGELGEGEVYVPAGPFRAGGDPGAVGAPARRRLWADGFVIQRHPVTNADYVTYLNDLVAKGRADEALRRAPRERAGREGETGAQIYGRDADGRFFSSRDVEGNTWTPGHPVMMIDWFDVRAYARWLAETTGQPWRLPSEWEWEKAARGVDGRFFPWGSYLDPTWCCIQDSHAGRPLPSAVEAYLEDESPYGVRGLGGNVRDFCAEVYRPDGAPVSPEGVVLTGGEDEEAGEAHRVLRGGAWVLPSRDARSASRGACSPTYLFPVIGFRLARSLGDPSKRG